MAHYLVIVESPAKVKTIKKFLGSNYTVVASQGHVRDLPKSSLGIDVEHDYEPKFISISRGAFKDAFTAFFVISLKVILRIFFSSNFSAVARCHEIASPSRSGSVARNTLSDFFASFRKAARISPFPLIVMYFGS